MTNLNALASLVCAVETGSLSGAARRRRLSQPAVSQQIAALEDHYNMRLLNRARTGVRPTEAGEVVCKRAMNILAEDKKLQRDLDALCGKISGQLTVTAGLGLSQHLLTDVVVDMAKRHPELKVLLRAENSILDMSRENIDLAIRFGQLGEGTGFARKIATLDVMYVATPAYLDQAGRPHEPDQLRGLDYIQYRANETAHVARFSRGTRTADVEVKTGLAAQFPDLIFRALYSNLGFAQLPVFLVDKAVGEGRLEQVLKNWQTNAADMFLVTPERDALSARSIAFLDVLFTHLRATVGIRLTASGERLLK